LSILPQADGKLLIAGAFTTVNGVPAMRVARLWGTDFPPLMQGVSRSGSGVELTWYAVPNHRYRVQYKDNLSSTGWTDIPGDIVAANSLAGKNDAAASGTRQRFYRVVQLE
jgi:hypothetical protein